MAKSKLLFETNDWTPEIIDRTYDAIAEISLKELKLDVYRNQIEIIGSDQMLDAYSSIGLPLMYNHWSFGKHFIINSQQYRAGQKGLAYEIVINSDPCISYLMEEDSYDYAGIWLLPMPHLDIIISLRITIYTGSGQMLVALLTTRYYQEIYCSCEEKYGEAR